MVAQEKSNYFKTQIIVQVLFVLEINIGLWRAAKLLFVYFLFSQTNSHLWDLEKLKVDI